MVHNRPQFLMMGTKLYEISYSYYRSSLSLCYVSGTLLRLAAGVPHMPTLGQISHYVTHVEMCLGMGKTGIPWVPWDSHWNGNKISHGMGMGMKCMGMGIKTWEWE